MRRLAIAALQLELGHQNNLEVLDREIRTAKRRYPWIDLIIVPELAVYGVNMSYREKVGEKTEQHFQQLARELCVWLIPGSLYQLDGEQTFNVAPVINPEGSVVARCRKIFPFLPYEQGVAGGREFCVFDLPSVGRVGVCICYDNWFPEVLRSLVALGAEFIICPTMTNTIDRDVEVTLARANAAMQQVYFLSVNAAGRLGNGRSILVAPDGKVLHESGTTHDIIAIELDFDRVTEVRERGLDGLGQVLKSFRDADMTFSIYQQSSLHTPGLQSLGPLRMPDTKR
jgi:predicted amidohydrolase